MPVKPPSRPPDLASLLDLWTRVVPDDFWRHIQGTPSEAVFRGLASEMATLAAQSDRGTQGRFILPSTIQRAPPASLGVRWHYHRDSILL